MQKRTKFQVRSDASKQRWVRDDKKESFWRKHIADWKESGMSKRGYAISHNLAQSSFSAWCREIVIRDRERVPSANAAELLSSESDVPKSAFVSLRVVNDKEAVSHESSEERSGPVELLLPSGTVIRVSHNSDFTLIRRLLNFLEAK